MTIQTDTLVSIILIYVFARFFCLVGVYPFNLLTKFNWLLDFLTIQLLALISLEMLSVFNANEDIISSLNLLIVMTSMEILYPALAPYMQKISNLFKRIDDKRKGVPNEQL